MNTITIITVLLMIFALFYGIKSTLKNNTTEIKKEK